MENRFSKIVDVVVAGLILLGASSYAVKIWNDSSESKEKVKVLQSELKSTTKELENLKSFVASFATKTDKGTTIKALKYQYISISDEAPVSE